MEDDILNEIVSSEDLKVSSRSLSLFAAMAYLERHDISFFHYVSEIRTPLPKWIHDR